MFLNNPQGITQTPTRIISVVPSITELLHYLQLDQETIAITKFCIHPNEWFQNKTRIGGTKKIDIDKIKSLSPDLIIANKEENIKEEIEILAQQFNVWLTDINTLEDAIVMIEDIGNLTNRVAKATALAREIREEFETFVTKKPLKKVAYLIWNNPFMTIGGDTYINNMLMHAGYKNVFDNILRYPVITIEEIQQSGCKYLFLSSEPYPFAEKHAVEIQKDLPGIKIVLVDGEMFSWYGSRLLWAPQYFKTLYNSLLV